MAPSDGSADQGASGRAPGGAASLGGLGRAPRTRPPGRRSQVTLFGLIAVSVMLIVIMLAMLRSGEVERRVAAQGTESLSLKDKMEALRTSVDAQLRTATYDAVWDLAGHGGYSSGNVPALNHIAVPFWLYRGRVVNVPAAAVMEDMLARDIERRMLAALEPRRSDPSLDIGMPRVKASLADASVKATMALSVRAVGSDGAEAKSTEDFQAVLPLRLKTLRDLAEGYVREYESSRMMERALLTSITQDSRIPRPPGGEAAKNVDCDKPPAKHRNDLVYPFRENAKLAVARELRRIRSKPLENIHWSAELNDRDVDFTLLANPGREGFESRDEVRFIPRPLLPFSVERNTCSSYYFVTYNVTFPVLVSVTDLAPSGAVASQESRPLSFSFYVGAFLEGDEPESKAPEAEVGAPESVDALCQGSCSVELSIKGSGSGMVCIDSCCSPYAGGSFSRSQVQCKVHELVVTPDEVGLARWSERVSIGRTLSKTVALVPFASVGGTVLERNRLLCEGSGRVVEGAPSPLGFVEGNPPRYVEVFFAPLDRSLGQTRRATTDESGRYSLASINPGRYVALALPSSDAGRIPGYKVRANATIVELKPGPNSLDFALEPLGIERVGERYVPITARKRC